MRNIDDIVNDVQARLRQESRGVERRRRRVAELAKIRSAWTRPEHVLRHRKDAVFTVDQTRMLAMKRTLSLKLKLLVRGHHVADVELDRVSGQMTLKPRSKVLRANNIAMPKKGVLQWSHNPDDGQAIRDFLGECARELAGRTPELQVQLQLVRMLKRSGKPRALTNLRPVLPFGFPTEIATVVDRRGNATSSTGKPVTGNMDILARTVQGARGEFVVLELKPPGLTAEHDVASAFEQAIGYAAALACEANDPGDPSVATSYRQLYGPRSSTAPNYDGLGVTVNAVVVLPIGCKAFAKNSLTAMGKHSTLHVGALLYHASQDRNQYLLDDSSFEWVGWRP